MTIFRKELILRTMPALLLALALSCTAQEGGTYDPSKPADFRPVQLALSLGTPATKGDVSAITEMADAPVFRGLTDIRVLPFSEAGEIASSDISMATFRYLPSIVSQEGGSGVVLYSDEGIYLPRLCSSVLLYGRAIKAGDDESGTIAEKQLNGSLRETGAFGDMGALRVQDLTLEPVVMFGEGETPVQALRIASVLSSILLGEPYQTEVFYGDGQHQIISINWNESIQDSNLREAYRQVTNEGSVIPGSGYLTEALLSSLYSMLLTYESYNTNVYEVVVDGVPYEVHQQDGTPILYRDLYNQLRNVLLARFTAAAEDLDIDSDNLEVSFKDPELSTYPENLGLPSGSAILRWTPTGFVVPQIGGVEGLAPMNRYCFPPSLYYYANTVIRTSEELDIAKIYTDGGYTNWDDILSDDSLGSSITSRTKSVVLVEPAQFAVAMLSTTVKAERARLQDNDGLAETTVEATGGNLPLTGIILGGQYAQRYDFTPIETEDGEYYLYDNVIPDVCLTTETSAPVRTLSLETPADKDIYFSLEFRNDSGKTFYGADGRVLPGRKFYMVGKLTLPPAPRDFESVFVKDHMTTLTCTIKSLDGAYNAVPDLGMPQLVLGVQTQVNWVLSSPTTLLLE